MSARPVIRLGVVGLSTQGWASFGLIPTVLQLPGSPYKVVALSTLHTKSPEQIEELRAKFGHDLQVYTSSQEMAMDDNIDLFVVSVKSTDHEKSVLPALDSNLTRKKHVFLEWPACGSVKACQFISSKTKELGVRTMVGMQGRQSTLLKKLGDILKGENGEKGIGKIMSSSVIGGSPKDDLFWGSHVRESSAYITDVSSKASMLHVLGGHLLDPFLRLFGDVATITSSQTITFPETILCNDTGTETLKTTKVTAPDQVAFSGVTKSNVLFSFHFRAGFPLTEGRTNFLWIIDGTEGSVRVEGKGNAGSFLNIKDPILYLNGKPVDIPVDPLGKIGRAWAEFAKGEDGDYANIDDAIKVLQIIEAVIVSGEKRVSVTL